jgi:hypothetical protein
MGTPREYLIWEKLPGLFGPWLIGEEIAGVGDCTFLQPAPGISGGD